MSEIVFHDASGNLIIRGDVSFNHRQANLAENLSKEIKIKIFR